MFYLTGEDISVVRFSCRIRFSVNAIEYLEGELPYGDVEGGCNFTVNVSKNGVVQEPDRAISLQTVQDGWEVVNEGY